MYTFPNFEPVHCSRSNSNCCFLTCMHISQEAGKVVWYFHLLKNFPVYCDPHKSFSIVNEAEVDVFLEFCCFFFCPMDVGNLISGSSAFSKSSLFTWKFCLSPTHPHSWIQIAPGHYLPSAFVALLCRTARYMEKEWLYIKLPKDKTASLYPSHLSAVHTTCTEAGVAIALPWIRSCSSPLSLGFLFIHLHGCERLSAPKVMALAIPRRQRY